MWIVVAVEEAYATSRPWSKVTLYTDYRHSAFSLRHSRLLPIYGQSGTGDVVSKFSTL